ncbi:MAG: transglycosylase domain-containing protein, partial [Verrucomicrobiota bacterium]
MHKTESSNPIADKISFPDLDLEAGVARGEDSEQNPIARNIFTRDGQDSELTAIESGDEPKNFIAKKMDGDESAPDIDDTSAEEADPAEDLLDSNPVAGNLTTDEIDGEVEKANDVTRKKRHRIARWGIGFVGGFIAILLIQVAATAIFFILAINSFLDKRVPDYDLTEMEIVPAGALATDASGKRIGRTQQTERQMVAYSELPDHLIAALIAAEDQRFYEHNGFDFRGILRAATTNYRAGGIKEGASTITQQLTRNVFELGDKSLERKLLEVGISRQIEKEYSKQDILESYLNRIYFGSGFYGVGTAAFGFFGKHVSELTIDESALLCGLIRSPARFSPIRNMDAAIAGRNRTLSRMHSVTGFLSKEEMDEALAMETTIDPLSRSATRYGQASYLLSRIEEEARKLLGTDVPLDGLEITTTANLDLQASAADVLDSHLKELESQKYKSEESNTGLQGSVLVMENSTGNILTAIGTRDYSVSQYDRVWRLRRPSGSAFIPFVYAAAFDKGDITPETPVFDAPVDNRQVMLGGTKGVLGEWSTENAKNEWEGNIPAKQALQQSKNSPAVRVGFETGLDRVGNLAARAGITSPLKPFAGSFLGASEMALPELARAYSSYPNGGSAAPAPGIISKITDTEGNVLYTRPKEFVPGPKVMTKETADTISSSTLDVDSVFLVGAADRLVGFCRACFGAGGSS